MGKDVYIHIDDKNIGHPLRRYRRLVAWIMICLIFAAVILTTLWYGLQNLQPKYVYQGFITAWETKDYDTAKNRLVDLKDGALSGNKKRKSNYAGYCVKAEDTIRAKREAYFSTWRQNSAKETPLKINDDGRNFMRAFKEYNRPYIHDYMVTVCNDIMAEKITTSQGEKIFRLLGEIPEVGMEAQEYLKVLPSLGDFSGKYKMAVKSADLINQAKLFQQMLSSINGADMKALHALFNGELNKLLVEIRKNDLAAAEHALLSGQYYTAKKKIAELSPLFASEAKFKTLQSKVQALNLPELVEYSGPVYAVNLLPLVRHPQVAMNSALRKFYMQKVLPQESALAVLTSLHSRGFVLVNPLKQLDKNGKFRPWLLPAGKKPLVLTINGMNYDNVRMVSGSFKNLAVVNGRRVSQSIAPDGSVLVEEDAEITGLVDRFVKSNTDFSFDGARGIIALSGRKPTFGYVTTTKQMRAINAELAEQQKPLYDVSEDNLKLQQRQAKAVADTLKAEGWIFASAGYDIKKFDDLSSTELKQDLDLWRETMVPVIGDTHIFSFLGIGAPGWEDAKLQLLKNSSYFAFIQNGSQFLAASAEHPWFINSVDINPLQLYFNKLDELIDCQAAYKGIIHAKMYDPPRTERPTKRRRR